MPEPLEFYEFDPPKSNTICPYIPVILPKRLHQKTIYAGIEMGMVPDLPIELKSALSKGRMVGRFTPNLTLGMRQSAVQER